VDLGRNPAINVIKTASPSSLTSPVAGQTLSYAYKVTNTGNVTLTSVTLLDDKTGSVALAAATLSPGASTTGSSSYILTQADIDAGSVINTALVTGTPPAGPNVTAAATATVTLGRNPAISLTKSLAANADQDGSGDVSAGDVLTFQFTATNAGNVTLSTVTITDPLPGMVLSACSASSLAPGASLACTGTYMVTADDVQAGQVVNVATASGTPPPGSGPDVTGTDSETVPVKKAALSLTKTAVVTQVTQTLVNNATVSGSNAAAATYSTSNTVAVSSRITYTLTVSNTGNGNAVNVVLTDTMPAGVVIVANPDGGTVTGNSVTWALGAVAAGASTSVTITVEVA
jgi:uncharacterized repeat protein (TIGR01451 family)